MAQGSQGPRSYMFGAQRVRVTRKGKPGQEAWAVYRRNLDGSEPRSWPGPGGLGRPSPGYHRRVGVGICDAGSATEHTDGPLLYFRLETIAHLL